MYGHYGTTIGGRKSARRIAVFYLAGALVFGGNLLPNGKRVLAFQVAKLRDRHPDWFLEDATVLFELLAERKIEPVIAERSRSLRLGVHMRTSVTRGSRVSKSWSAKRQR